MASAVEANMNTLRVWGGGVWPPPALLDAADELELTDEEEDGGA